MQMESWRERGFVPDSDDEEDFDSQGTANPSINDRNGGQVSWNVAVVVPSKPEEPDHVRSGDRANRGVLGSSERNDGASHPASSSQSAGAKNDVVDGAEWDGVQSAPGKTASSALKSSRGKSKAQMDGSDNQTAVPSGHEVPSALEVTMERGQEHTTLPTTEVPDLPATSNLRSFASQIARPHDIWDVPSSPDELQLDNWRHQRPASPPQVQGHSRPRSMCESSSQSTLSSPPASLLSLRLDERREGQAEREHTLASPRDDSNDLPPPRPAHPSHFDDGQGQVEQERTLTVSGDDLEDLIPSLDIPDDILQELSHPAGRSLRHRNPIQLHPYLLEDAKYQRLMKARGVKPVRIAQYQDALRAAANNSQRQGHTAAQPPSRILASNRQFSLSSPGEFRQSPLNRTQLDTPGRRDFRDPSPLNQPSTGARRRTYKRRKISHDGHTRDRQRQQDLSQRERENNMSYLNRPGIPSPPRSESVSSAYTADFSGEFRFPRGATPPPLTTPVTEPKLRSTDTDNASAMDLSGSIPDQSANTTSTSLQTQPSSDEEDDLDVEVTQMRRRIKGVLPASWLRLDYKKQEERVRSSQWKRDLAQRPENTKGVAKRVSKSSTATRSAPRQLWTSMMDLADNDEDDDDGSDRDPAQENTGQALADLVGFEDPFHDQVWDDIPEDNRIDYMLPSIPRRPRSGRWKQGLKRQRPERDSIRTGGYSKRARLKRQTRITDPAYGARNAKQTPNISRGPAVLHAPDVAQRPRKEQPPFLRVAARQARLRRNGRRPRALNFPSLGSRHGSGNKHASSRQKQSETPQQPSLKQSRPRTDKRQPLALRSANEQLVLDGDNDEGPSDNGVPEPTVPPEENSGTSGPASHPHIPDSASKPGGALGSKQPSLPGRLGNKWVIRRNLGISSLKRNAPRPAIPEMEDAGGDFASPSLFQRSLSQLNRDYRQRRAAQARMPKAHTDRFLIDNPSPAAPLGNQRTAPAAGPNGLDILPGGIQPRPRPRQLKKRPPTRLAPDTSGLQEIPAAFSQGSEPSPVEVVGYLGSSPQRSVGLSGFQPSYPIDFGVGPLCPGTFFHDSTFLGSGEFSRLQKIVTRDLDKDAGSISISFGGLNCHWGAWNETVSSGLGAAFDTLIDGVEKNGRLLSDGSLVAITTQGCALYRSLVKYITETLSFIDPVDRAGFVTRANDLVYKLNERLSGSTLNAAHSRRYSVKLCFYNLVFASQICHIASHSLVDRSLANDILGLVHSVARQLFAFISNHAGLEEIREFLKGSKLSECRDAGIHDNPSVEAFVIAHHLLRGSDKYEGGFESITTKAYLPSTLDEATDSKDIGSLETGWQNLFTILPLNEIDEFGIAHIGSRFRESFDNWKFVQRLLSPVLDDYGSNPSGQPISYINYCRVLFRRCFHLINDWGWRHCKPILETLYDFFARRTLYNLNYEECFGSPNFLEDLDQDPLLAVTPRDSCFHILLKIIGRGLRSMSKTHEKKRIRNYAWRLLPNHGRVYPKEMPLHQEDLDALRNHHDLLCTLYWAVPEECRPRLETIKNLVDPSTSHRETCKISLRSWMRLARFKLSTEEDVSGLDPFADWHSYFVTELLKQHAHARTEVEAQSNGVGRFSHQVVERTISQNQQQIELLLSIALGALHSAVQLSPTLEHARRLVSKSPIQAILGLFNSKFARINSIVSEALRIVVAYTEKCDATPPSAAVAATSDDDSQEYGDWKEIFSQEDTKPSQGIEHVQQTFHPAVSRLVSNCFGEDHSPEDPFLLTVVHCWTSVAQTLARHRLRHWDSYLSPYDGDSWTSLRATVQMRKFTPQFLASCIEKDSRFYAECKAQVLGMWMSALVERASMLKFQHRLTAALLNQDLGDPLLKNLPFSKNRKDDRYSITLEDFSQRRLSLISSLLSNMREHVQEMEDVESWEYKAAKQEYGELIQRLMASMKSNYQELGNGVQPTQGAYVDFVHCVVGFLQQHTRDICAIDSFFTDPKSFPLPSADPRYIVAKLKSYEPKLSSEKAVKALTVFIQGVSERAATDGEQVYLVGQLAESMVNTYEGGSPNRPTLRAVLLQCVLPAYIEVAFKHPAAWILSRPIAQTVSLAFKGLLFNMDTTDPSCVFSVTNIFASVFQATYQAFHFLSEDPDMLKEPTALVTATTFIEVITASLSVIEYIDRVTESGEKLVLQVQAFRQFTLFALSRIRDETLPCSLERFYRLAGAFTTPSRDDIQTSSAPTFAFPGNLCNSASRELLSYISENYSHHQGKYYFTRRGGGSLPREVKIDAAVAARLDNNVPELEFEDSVRTFTDHLECLDLFGEGDLG